MKTWLSISTYCHQAFQKLVGLFRTLLSAPTMSLKNLPLTSRMAIQPVPGPGVALLASPVIAPTVAPQVKKTRAEWDVLLRANMVARVMKDVGSRETNGPNRSPLIDAINKRAHCPLGSSYCASGATEDFADICIALGLQNPVGIHGGSQDVINLTPSRYRSIHSGKKGDLAGFTDRGNKGKGHIATLTDDMVPSLPKQFKTAEYNTNGAGSRNGDGIWTHVRSTDGNSALEFRYFLDIVSWTLDFNKIV